MSPLDRSVYGQRPALRLVTAPRLLSIRYMRVWLTRKLAQRVDGIDLSDREVGDVLDLSPREAALLVAEEYARPDRRAEIRSKDPDESDLPHR